MIFDLTSLHVWTIRFVRLYSLKKKECGHCVENGSKQVVTLYLSNAKSKYQSNFRIKFIWYRQIRIFGPLFSKYWGWSCEALFLTLFLTLLCSQNYVFLYDLATVFWGVLATYLSVWFDDCMYSRGNFYLKQRKYRYR